MKERSIKELLEFMLKNQRLFSRGLCYWCNQMYDYGLLKTQEYLKLRMYIDENRPSPFSSFNALIYFNNNYYWRSGKIKPRIKWIKKHIKLQENEK
jgi:hypothetical protein